VLDLLVDPAWYVCTTDDDCVVAEGVCEQPVAINKAFATEFHRHAVASSREIECEMKPERWYEWKNRVVARCVSGRCTIVDPGDKPGAKQPSQLPPQPGDE
jgi:hypothetical protein